MRVTLNCHRAGRGPGDVVEVPDGEAAALIHYGGALPAVDEPEPPAGTGASSDASNDAPSTKPGPAAAAAAPQASAGKPPGEAGA